MNIPTWVPKPIAAHVLLLLHGEPKDQFGFLAALESARISGDTETVKILEVDISLLNRLVGIEDDRMKEAYELLAHELTGEDAWRAFARATWAARMNYGRIREKLSRAKELRTQISRKARELVSLLHEAGHYYDNWPGELYSMSALLEATHGHDLLWRGLRKHLLGNEDIMGSTRYIWSTAPSVPECLSTLADAAENFEPIERGMIGRAIQTRQANAKTEYIRAFGAKLTDEKIPITPTVMKAMVIAVNVALNDENLDVSSQDIRQALTRVGITRD